MAIVRLRPGDLKRAIADGMLSLQYQPQVHAPSGKLVGAEAFVRWPHPAYGMIGPSDIIPLIEQGGFHIDFDRWVVTSLCEQIRRWELEGFDVPVVAANVWAQTLRSPGAVDMIRDVVTATGARVDVLEIECPRGTVGDETLVGPARKLRALGARLASEEFGDPALAAAAKDFDTLKIGYPLAREITVAGSTSVAQVAAIVAAARPVGARVAADNVESREQEDALVALGCEIVEGYLYGPEVSAAELKQLAAVGAKARPIEEQG
ncbi:MAG TPA: EAL domain-containing protein [Candidatus Limnocylindria bacterium]|jgi:EAL domain-containing protein (putative c-di-GMP-specific phosphodiesterase class I)